MKKILVLMLSRGVGGLEKRTATFFNHLESQNLDCQVVFLVNRAQVGLLDQYRRPVKNVKCELAKFGIPWSLSKSSGKCAYVFDYAMLVLKLLLMMRKGYYDVAYFTKFASLPLRHLVRAKKKILALVDSHTTERIVDSAIFVKILKESFLIDCLSQDLRDAVLSRKNCKQDQVFATPYSFIDYSNTGIKKKERIITFCGRLAPGKGVELLISALPEILEQNDVRVQIIGDGPLLQNVKRVVGKFGNKTVFIGYSSEPTQFLKRSLVFLSLQERENYPSQSLIEAMACGNSIIATDVGLTHRLVDKDTGMLIDRDPKSLVEAIHKLLNDFEGTERKGCRAREIVTTRHTAENYLRYLRDNLL